MHHSLKQLHPQNTHIHTYPTPQHHPHSPAPPPRPSTTPAAQHRTSEPALSGLPYVYPNRISLRVITISLPHRNPTCIYTSVPAQRSISPSHRLPPTYYRPPIPGLGPACCMHGCMCDPSRAYHIMRYTHYYRAVRIWSVGSMLVAEIAWRKMGYWECR